MRATNREDNNKLKRVEPDAISEYTTYELTFNCPFCQHATSDVVEKDLEGFSQKYLCDFCFKYFILET